MRRHGQTLRSAKRTVWECSGSKVPERSEVLGQLLVSELWTVVRQCGRFSRELRPTQLERLSTAADGRQLKRAFGLTHWVVATDCGGPRRKVLSSTS